MKLRKTKYLSAIGQQVTALERPLTRWETIALLLEMDLALASKEATFRYLDDLRRAGFLAPISIEPGYTPTAKGWQRIAAGWEAA